MYFETQRLILKPILERDLHILHNIFTNPFVRKYLTDDVTFPLSQVEKMIQESQSLFVEQGFGLWFVQIKDLQKTIGFVGLWYFFAEVQPQLVYALLPEATKNGYATEAASKILEYCFNDLEYQYLIASCDKHNLSSRKVAERVGMKEFEEMITDNKPIVFFKAIRV